MKLRDPRLAEASCGQWEGSLHDDLCSRWPREWGLLASNDLTFRFPEGESLQEVLARFSEAMHELDARHADGTVLVVAHGGPMRLFLMDRGVAVHPSEENGAPLSNLEGYRMNGDAIELITMRRASRG